MPSVLIADDEPHLRLLVSATLAASECRLLEAADGDQAWALLKAEQPDVAVLDVMMPGRTGLELVQLIRQDPDLSTTRVILLTAKDQPGDAEAGRRAGADLYLTKPFSPMTLLNAVTCDFAIASGRQSGPLDAGTLRLDAGNPANRDRHWQPALTVKSETTPAKAQAPLPAPSSADPCQPRWPKDFVDERRLWELLGCTDERALSDLNVARRLALLQRRLKEATRRGQITRFVARDPSGGTVVAHGYRKEDLHRLFTARNPA